MSIIYGVVDFDKQLNKQTILDELKKTGLKYDFDADNQILESDIGIGCLHRKTTFQSQNEKQPYQDKECILVASSRLDGREELMDKLKIPQQQLNAITDSELIVCSYKKWGQDCVKHLIGDWVFALWDNNQKRLLLAKDHIGGTACYYLRKNNSLIFCSNLHGLLGLTSYTPQFNNDYLMRYCIGAAQLKGKFLYKGIDYVYPSSYLEFSQNQLTESKYWSPETIPINKSISKEEAYKELIQLFSLALKDRQRHTGIFGSTLSGGLDSSSVAVLTADMLRNKGQVLRTYTAVPAYDYGPLSTDSCIYNEEKPAQEIADYNGNMQTNFVNGNNYTYLEALKLCIAISGGLVYTPSNAHWFQDIYQQALKQGTNTILTGQYGNLGISWKSWPKYNIASILKNYRGIQRVKKLLKYSFPFLDGIFYEKTIEGLKFLAPPIRSSAKAQKARRETKNYNISLKKLSSVQRRKRSLQQFTESGNYWQSNALHFNLNIIDPTSDLRLLEFCFALPDEFTYKRKLIREAMKQRLPDKIRLNEKFGYQCIDGWQRIVRDKKQIDEAIVRWEKNDKIKNMLDLKYLREVFHLIIDAENPTYYLKFNTYFDRVICTALLLERFSS